MFGPEWHDRSGTAPTSCSITHRTGTPARFRVDRHRGGSASSGNCGWHGEGPRLTFGRALPSTRLVPRAIGEARPLPIPRRRRSAERVAATAHSRVYMAI